MKSEIDELIENAKESLRIAKVIYGEKSYNFAISRAYYAIFYICGALLLKKNLRFSKHSALISAISNNYVKTGELPQKFHKILHTAFKFRQDGDYAVFKNISKEAASELISEIEKQINVAIQLLKAD